MVGLVKADRTERGADLLAGLLAGDRRDDGKPRLRLQIGDRDDGRAVDRIVDPPGVNLDDVRRPLVVDEERGPERAPRRAISSPEHVRARMREKAPGGRPPATRR